MYLKYNKDENVHRYTVRGKKDRERYREKKWIWYAEREIIHSKRGRERYSVGREEREKYTVRGEER